MCQVICLGCGARAHRGGCRQCRAYNRACMHCHKLGYFRIVCQGKQGSQKTTSGALSHHALTNTILSYATMMLHYLYPQARSITTTAIQLTVKAATTDNPRSGSWREKISYSIRSRGCILCENITISTICIQREDNSRTGVASRARHYNTSYRSH